MVAGPSVLGDGAAEGEELAERGDQAEEAGANDGLVLAVEERVQDLDAVLDQPLAADVPEARRPQLRQRGDTAGERLTYVMTWAGIPLGGPASWRA